MSHDPQHPCFLHLLRPLRASSKRAVDRCSATTMNDNCPTLVATTRCRRVSRVRTNHECVNRLLSVVSDAQKQRGAKTSFRLSQENRRMEERRRAKPWDEKRERERDTQPGIRSWMKREEKNRREEKHIIASLTGPDRTHKNICRYVFFTSSTNSLNLASWRVVPDRHRTAHGRHCKVAEDCREAARVAESFH